MTKIIYITHPSVAIVKDVVPSRWDISEKGREEAKKLLQLDFWQEVEVLFTSTELKTVSVGKMVQEKYGLHPTAYPELGEADRTKTPFLPLGEYMTAVQEAYDHPDKHIHGWESHHEMFERNKKIIDKIISENEEKTIAIIGHGGAGTCVKCYLTGLELRFEQDPKQTGCIFIVDADERILLQDWHAYAQ